MKTAESYSPGRVELLGNHTDYNRGVVLAAAIERGLHVRGRSRDDERITLTSEALGRTVETTLAAEVPVAEAWAKYPLCVVRQMRADGLAVRGFEAVISGDLPIGGGLSSSAAIEVAMALFLIRLHGFRVPALTVAKLCHRAENTFVGVPSGLLDPVTCIFARADHIVHLDCRDEFIETVPFPHELRLIIASSGTAHQLVEGGFGNRRAECAAAADAFGVRSLRDLSAAAVERYGAAIDPVLRRRALHVTAENERVEQARAAMGAGDAARFGALMNASHHSSRTLFENSTPELDLLTEIARGCEGVLGARLTGGGFGGSIVALARSAQAAAAAEAMRVAYRERTGIDALPFLTHAAEGAG